MKKLFIVSVILILSSYASADADDVLRECQITCSTRCKEFADDLIRKAQDIVNCTGGGSSSRADIINACVSGFGNGSSGEECSREANSADTVKACVDRFGNGTSGMTCAKSNSGEDTIYACVEGFGNGTSGLKCATSNADPETVKTCVSRFGNGSSGLECATGI